MSTKLQITAGFLAALLLVAVWLQRQRLQVARAEQQSVAAEPTQPATPLKDLDEIEGLREQTRELPRSRNEVRQLRSQTNALAKAQVELQRLLAELARMTNAPPAPPTPEQGFVMNNLWANAGLSTPESTIQTYFWALRQRDVETLAACLEARELEESGLLDRATGQWRSEGLEPLFDLFGAVPGFRIVEVQSSAEDKVRVQVQAAVNGEAISFSLTRISHEWKLSGL